MSDHISANFDREEFQCACGCGYAEVAPRLVGALQSLRDQVGKPIRILSGCRCPSHNRVVGGAPQSKHLTGEAADIAVAGMTARQLYTEASNVPGFKGFGVSDEGGFIHVDVREIKAKWCYRDGKELAWFEGGSA